VLVRADMNYRCDAFCDEVLVKVRTRIRCLCSLDAFQISASQSSYSSTSCPTPGSTKSFLFFLHHLMTLL
jgi:hypothetical protein